MTRFLGAAASVLVKVLMRKSISLFDEFSCLFLDLASLLWSAVRFSTIIARQPSSSFSSAPSSSAASASASASARRHSPILMSMAIRHRVY